MFFLVFAGGFVNLPILRKIVNDAFRNCHLPKKEAYKPKFGPTVEEKTKSRPLPPTTPSCRSYETRKEEYHFSTTTNYIVDEEPTTSTTMDLHKSSSSRSPKGNSEKMKKKEERGRLPGEGNANEEETKQYKGTGVRCHDDRVFPTFVHCSLNMRS